MCILIARPLLKICIGLAKAKVQGRLGLTALLRQHRWESDAHGGRSLCVSPPANTGSLGTGTLHLTSQGIHIMRASHTHTNIHKHTHRHMLRLLLPLPLLYGPARFPASHTLPGKPESLCLIRVIETGPPGTKELLNCYPLTHLKDHLIKTFCVWFYSLPFSAFPSPFLSYFSFIPFFFTGSCQIS